MEDYSIANSTGFIRDIRIKRVSEYAQKRGVDASRLSAEEFSKLEQEMISEGRIEAEKTQIEEDERKKAEDKRLREQRYRDWIETSVPKRYQKARMEDFMETVYPLFSLDLSALIIGGNGIGKSHLAWALAKRAKWDGKTVFVTNLYRLLSDIKGCENWSEMVSKYAGFDFLVIDEYDKCHGTESDFILLSELVDERYNDMKPTIIIGNGTSEQAQKLLGQSVYSRLTSDGGKLFSLGGTDRRRSPNG